MNLEVDSHPKTLFGYEVISHLGEGAASSIYAVSEPETGQIYALKRVLRKDEKSQRFIDQLTNELEVSKKVGVSPYIRRIIDLKYARTLLRTITEAALVMELIDAMPLSKLQGAKPETDRDLAWTLRVLSQTATGMAAINRAGYVHCDMKPENIMVLPDGTAKVIDLGQACPNGTGKDRVQGSPMFIAPEQMDKTARKVTFRTDVFNFGATLYWAVSGQFFPTDYAVKKRLTKLRPSNAPSPRELNPAIPEALSALAMECVQSNVMDRPDSMVSVAAKLAQLVPDALPAPAHQEKPTP